MTPQQAILELVNLMEAFTTLLEQTHRLLERLPAEPR